MKNNGNFGGFVMKKEKNNNILKKLSPLSFFCDIIVPAAKFLCRKDSLDMGCEVISLLKQIYGAASIPVAIADEKLDVLWKNPAAEASEFFKDGSAQFLFPNNIYVDGIVSVCVDGAFQLFNVIRYMSEKTYYIIEYTGKDFSYDISQMKSYFIHLCARLRESAGQIAMSADGINLAVKKGSTEVASDLNRIDRNIMLLLREAVIPEQVYYAIDPYCKNEIVRLEDEVALSALDAENTLGRATEVWQNAENNIAVNINRSVLETVLAYMTAESCCGELFPDRLEYNVQRIDDERASVSVRCVNLHGKKNINAPLSLLRQTEPFMDKLYKKLLAEKYGVVFEKKIHPDGIESIMLLNVLAKQNVIVKSGKKFRECEERFSPMAVSLSEKHCGERYKNIKINV